MAPDNSLLLALGLVESANAVGIAPRTLRKAASEGAIPSVKLGRRLLFKVADLEEFLARHTRNGRAAVELKAKSRR
jgi:excisionase family DNA binding protein